MYVTSIVRQYNMYMYIYITQPFYSTLCARVPGLTSRHHHNLLAAIIVSTMALILQRTLAIMCVMHTAYAPSASSSASASNPDPNMPKHNSGKKKGNNKALSDASLREMIAAPTSEYVREQEEALQFWTSSLRQQEIADQCPPPPDLSHPNSRVWLNEVNTAKAAPPEYPNSTIAGPSPVSNLNTVTHQRPAPPPKRVEAQPPVASALKRPVPPAIPLQVQAQSRAQGRSEKGGCLYVTVL